MSTAPTPEPAPTTPQPVASDPPPPPSGAPAVVHGHPGPQAGILNRPPQHLLLAALDLTGPDTRGTVEAIRAVVRNELQSELADTSETQAGETGELGYDPHHDRGHLTITLGFAASTYTKLGVPADEQPHDLVPIPWDKLEPGVSPVPAANGDLALQICADDPYIVEHVLRRIEHELVGQVQVVWVHTGVQRYNSRPGRTARREGRAWIGFLDGTSNLDPKHSQDDYKLTFVDPDPAVITSYPKVPPSGPSGGYGNVGPSFPTDLRQPPSAEPAWTRDGTYMAVRISAQNVAEWDTTTTAAQEHVIGRFKATGVSLDLPNDPGNLEKPPAFATNQTDLTVAVTAHVRKANPRRSAEDELRRIYRRGYPLYEGTNEGLRRGLVFVAFGRTLSTQFEFITRAWLTNANFPEPNSGVDLLRHFDPNVLAGGYYFVPPLEYHTEPWSWHVPAAATS